LTTASLAAASPVSHGAGDPTDTAARRRLGELLALLDRDDPESLVAYARDVLAADGGGAADALAELRDRTGGIDPVSVDAAGAEATAQGRAKLTEERVALRVRVEPQPPYRVTWFGTVRPVPSDEPPASRLPDDRIAASVDAYARRLADADAFGGVVLLAREGRPFLLRAYGQANRDFHVPNDPATRFNVGSVTKVFTAVAVLQLVERGRLSLDEPLGRFVPDVPDADSARRITVRHLLSHTSGLGDHVNAMARDPFRTRYRSVDRMVELVRGVPPVSEPGARWRYSNSGFLLLGRVIERAAGGDYYEHVRANVLRPAEMNDTDFYELDRVNGPLAVGYQKEFHGGRRLWRNNQFDLFVRGGPEGGAYSTAGDLLRFDRALRGGRLLGPQMLALALAAQTHPDAPQYGLGFEVEEGGRIVGHGGSFVGAQAKLDMYPAGDYTAVVLSNVGGAARPVVSKVRSLLLAPK
jgi:CubicO group peptidase (beta-lactamase class C family)